MTKKIITLLFLMFSFSTVLFSQTTNVTATITDSDGITWTSAQWSVSFVTNGIQSNSCIYQLNGQSLCSNTWKNYLSQNGISDPNTGAISVTLLDNSQITPSGSKFIWTVQSNTSAPATQYTPLTISGASMNLSSFLSVNSIAPRFVALGTQSFGYADVEINPTPNPGAFYYNNITQTTRQWSGPPSNVWQNLVTSSWNGGTVVNPVTAPGLNSNNLASTSNVAIKNKSSDNIQYVSPNGSDSYDGLSWGSAKATINAAETALTNGGTIEIANGTSLGITSQLVLGDGTHPITIHLGAGASITNNISSGCAIMINSQATLLGSLGASLNQGTNATNTLFCTNSSIAVNYIRVLGVSFIGNNKTNQTNPLVLIQNVFNTSVLRDDILSNWGGPDLVISNTLTEPSLGALLVDNCWLNGSNLAGAQPLLIQNTQTTGVISNITFNGGGIEHAGISQYNAQIIGNSSGAGSIINIKFNNIYMENNQFGAIAGYFLFNSVFGWSIDNVLLDGSNTYPATSGIEITEQNSTVGTGVGVIKNVVNFFGSASHIIQDDIDSKTFDSTNYIFSGVGGSGINLATRESTFYQYLAIGTPGLVTASLVQPSHLVDEGGCITSGDSGSYGQFCGLSSKVYMEGFSWPVYVHNTALGFIGFPGITDGSGGTVVLQGNTCTMSAGTTCTATVKYGTNCIATVQGSTPLYASCAISGTTLTITASASNSSTWGWIILK